jgi:hypothetical protein
MDTNIFQEMVNRWQSPVVARTEIETFTGGAMGQKYIANLDSAGKGPEGRFRLGRKVVYRADKLAEWLESRSEAIPERRRDA